jgi:hypothetical protein
MAKLDWLFLPVDLDDDDTGEGVRRLPIRGLNRLQPQQNPADRRSRTGASLKSTPGSKPAKIKQSLKKRC